MAGVAGPEGEGAVGVDVEGPLPLLLPPEHAAVIIAATNANLAAPANPEVMRRVSAIGLLRCKIALRRRPRHGHAGRRTEPRQSMDVRGS